MHKITVNGREIKTNYNEHSNYPMSNGEDKVTMVMELAQWILRDGCKYKSLESDDDMFQRLVARGYKTITFYRTTTRVRGLYDIIAYCK